MKQITDTLLMISPVNFYSNPQTAATNGRQVSSGEDVSKIVREEFDESVQRIKEKGIEVLLFEGTNEDTPDELFPNWITTYEDGTLILHPMFAENRRKERRGDIVDFLRSKYSINYFIDLSELEVRDVFLEGTGSLVLDRVNKVVYAALSERTSLEAVFSFGKLTGYQPFTFNTQQLDGTPVYHTDLLMSIGEDFIVVCYDLLNKTERNNLENNLNEIGREVIPITMDQFYNMAGNVLQVKNKDGDKYFIASSTALRSYTSEQLEVIKKSSEILELNIPTIEKEGGGSARCLIGDTFI